jgi:hypothetical protein
MEKRLCEPKRNCRLCEDSTTLGNVQECSKRYCETCKRNKETEYLCYIQPLKNVLPSSDKVLYVFYDFETMKNTRYTDTATVHVLNLLFIQQICSRCESSEDVQQDFGQSGKTKNSFWADPVGDMLAYLVNRNNESNKSL